MLSRKGSALSHSRGGSPSDGSRATGSFTQTFPDTSSSPGTREADKALCPPSAFFLVRGNRRNKPHRGCGSRRVLSSVGETEDKGSAVGKLKQGRRRRHQWVSTGRWGPGTAGQGGSHEFISSSQSFTTASGTEQGLSVSLQLSQCATRAQCGPCRC